MKKFNVGKVKTDVNNGVIKGIALNRPISFEDAKYIFEHILGCYMPDINNFNVKIGGLINEWLLGTATDNELSDFIMYYSGEPLKTFSLLPILSYLKYRKYYE